MKILILKNNISFDVSNEVLYFKDFFSTRLPFILDVEEKNVNISVTLQAYKDFKGFNPVTGKPQVMKNYGLHNSHKDQIRKIADSKYDVVMFMYDIDKAGLPSDGVATSWSDGIAMIDGTMYIQICTNKYLKDIGQLKVALPHEFTHTICWILKQKGYPVTDEMDMTTDGRAFYLNETPEASGGNFARTFRNIKPYLDKINEIVPDVVITRGKDNGKQTIGKLVAKRNGATFTCDTLELSWKNNQKNVSCINKGLYDVKYTFSWTFKKFTYELQKVLNRTGIRKHSGNYYTDIQGCILLGVNPKDINGDGQIDVTNSRNTIKTFEQFMGKTSYKLLIR